MSDSKLKQAIEELDERWKEVNQLVSALQQDYDNAIGAAERLKSKSELDRKLADRQAIERESSNLRNQKKLQDLHEKLRNEERNGNYPEAIKTAEQIHAQYSDEPRIEEKLTKLREQHAFYQPALETLGNLGIHVAALGMPLYQKIAYALHPKNKRDDLIKILSQPTRQFINGDMDVELYQQFCEVHLSDTALEAPPDTKVDYSDLADQVLSGYTVLFIGTEVADLYDDQRIDEQTLAQELADAIKYQNFQGGLSAIAELYQARPSGKKTLLDSLRQSLPQDAQHFSLYQSLAQTTQHLILVSSAYDCLLEDTFQQAGKPFVEISSIINRRQEYDIGHVVLNYSDDDKDEIVYPQEQLSTLNLLNTHSIIYKIRGTCVDTSGILLTARRDALTLSESSYLDFAENARKMVPNFIAEHLREREILFAGFSPRSWEERLLVRTLLSNRSSSDHMCMRMGNSSDLLEQAFWKKQNVEASDIDFNTLDEHLQEALS